LRSSPGAKSTRNSALLYWTIGSEGRQCNRDSSVSEVNTPPSREPALRLRSKQSR